MDNDVHVGVLVVRVSMASCMVGGVALAIFFYVAFSGSFGGIGCVTSGDSFGNSISGGGRSVV